MKPEIVIVTTEPKVEMTIVETEIVVSLTRQTKQADGSFVEEGLFPAGSGNSAVA